jgi:hypothetical protein
VKKNLTVKEVREVGVMEMFNSLIMVVAILLTDLSKLTKLCILKC